MNLDRNDFKMRTVATEYFYNGNCVTVKLRAVFVVPVAFYSIFGFDMVQQTVKATAKCNPDDVYNIELGEKMALARAEARAYKLLSNKLNRMWQKAFETLEALKPLKDAFNEKAKNCAEHNAKYVDNLSK